MKIIGVVGHAKAGKDTFVSAAMTYLELSRGIEINKHICKVAIADKIRELAEVMGFTKKQLTSQDLKEVVDPFVGVSPRTACQWIGNSFRKGFGDDIFLKIATKKIHDITDDNSIVFISDIRLPAEAKWFKAMGATLVKVVRPICTDNNDIYTDFTEVHVDEIVADYTIRNNKGTIDKYIEDIYDFLGANDIFKEA